MSRYSFFSTSFLILVFSVVVVLSRGQYDPSIPVLTFFFLIWTFFTLQKHAPLGDLPVVQDAEAMKLEIIFPCVGAVLTALKPNLLYQVHPDFYAVWRFIPFFLMTVYFLVPKLKSTWFLGAGFLFYYASVFYLSPEPQIDVFTSNRDAVQFFLRGLNPYSQSYTDIYAHQFDYAPGFLYWPGALYLQTVSQVFFHDIRIILALAWWGAGFYVPKKIQPSWWGLPFIGFGFEQGWLDPLLSACAAIALFVMQTREESKTTSADSWLDFTSLGAAIAVAASIKQYGFLIGIFVLLWLWLEKDYRALVRTIAWAAIFFLGLFLPLATWSISDFLHMTVSSHAQAHVRADSLNFSAFLLKDFQFTLSPLWQVFFTALGFALAALHLYRKRGLGRLQSIPEAWAIAFGFSMLFGKFGFCNYHWLLISFWLLSLVRRKA